MANKTIAIGAIFTIIILITAIIVVNKSCTRFINKVDNVAEEYKSKVGKKIVVEKDTLTILDYSMFNENFTLSNGAKVSKEYVDQNTK